MARVTSRQPTAITLVLAAGVLAWAAAPAGAAIVSTPQDCYSSRKPVDFVGVDFRKGAKYTATVAGKQVAHGTVTKFGDVAGSFDAPAPARSGPGERTFALRLSDGVRSATTRIRTTIFGADFKPSRGDPATLRVSFLAFDFGTARAIFLHYLRPNGRLRLTVKLGRTRGPCGTLRAARRRIFPFAARPGNWRLQFDTQRSYDRGSIPHVRLVVPIRRAR